MASIRLNRDDLRDERHTRAIYLQVVELSEPQPELSERYPGYYTRIGEKSGLEIVVLDGFLHGRLGQVQAHAAVGNEWAFVLEIDSVLGQPPTGDELLPIAEGAMDKIMADELNNSKLRDAVRTPMKKPGSRDKFENIAEETVGIGLTGMLKDDPITAADYFHSDGEGPTTGWSASLFDQLREVGEPGCKFAFTDARYSGFGSWSVVTDVTLCPALHERFLYKGGIKENAFVAWAVKKYPDRADNYAVWRRGDAAPTVNEARFALEMSTLSTLPEGWTAKAQEMPAPSE